MAYLRGNRIVRMCDACGGDGKKKTYLNGQESSEVTCDACGGLGYVTWGWVMADKENTPVIEEK